MRLCAALLLLLATASAQAKIITVDPSRYEGGTDISNAFEGVSLSTIWLDSSRLGQETGRLADAPFLYEPVFAYDCTGCGRLLEGSTVFGNDAPLIINPDRALTPAFSFSTSSAHFLGDGSDGGNLWGTEHWSALLIQFDQPTAFVQMIGGGKPANPFYFDLWSGEGTHVGRCFTNSDGGALEPGCTGVAMGPTGDIKDPWTLSFRSDDANIRFVTAGGLGGDQFVQSLVFTSVPEPSTLALFALLGLPLLQLRRRAGQKQG